MIEDVCFFDFDIEIDNQEDNYKLMSFLPLRNNFELKIGKGDKASFFGIPKFKSICGKRCILMEPRTFNLFRDFDTPIEIKPNTFYSVNVNVKVNWLDCSFDYISSSVIDGPILSPTNASYLSLTSSKLLKNVQVEEGRYQTEYTKLRRAANIIAIPTFNNIRTTRGKLTFEIYPLDIEKKQYLFIHSNIQYQSSVISIWIENNNMYLHDLDGIRIINLTILEREQWNYVEIEFRGSGFQNTNMYISDYIDGYHGYLRNLKIFKI